MPRKNTLAATAVLICLSAGASAQGPAFTDPAAIDRAVTDFTGAQIGEAGGARAPVDRRLRLAACPSPLAITPHGRRQDTIQVSCTDAGGWRIFVALAKGDQGVPNAAAQVLVAKGDSVSIAIEGRGFSVAQTGRALESGAAGDWIRVAPPGSRSSKSETIRARVERPGRVVIPLS